MTELGATFLTLFDLNRVIVGRELGQLRERLAVDRFGSTTVLDDGRECFDVVDAVECDGGELARVLVEHDVLESRRLLDALEGPKAERGILGYLNQRRERGVVCKRIESARADGFEVSFVRDARNIGHFGEKPERPHRLVGITYVTSDVHEEVSRTRTRGRAHSFVVVGVGELEQEPRRIELLDGDLADAGVGILLGDGGEQLDVVFVQLTDGVDAYVGIAVLPFRA